MSFISEGLVLLAVFELFVPVLDDVDSLPQLSEKVVRRWS